MAWPEWPFLDASVIMSFSHLSSHVLSSFARQSWSFSAPSGLCPCFRLIRGDSVAPSVRQPLWIPPMILSIFTFHLLPCFSSVLYSASFLAYFKASSSTASLRRFLWTQQAVTYIPLCAATLPCLYFCCCCCCCVTSVVADSVRPRRRQRTRLPRPWDSPGKNTGVGFHFLLQCMKVKSKSEVAQSCPTPSDPMDCSLPGSSIHGIFQARVLEWVAIAFFRRIEAVG